MTTKGPAPTFKSFAYQMVQQYGIGGVIGYIAGCYSIGLCHDIKVTKYISLMDVMTITVRRIAIPIIKSIGGNTAVGALTYTWVDWGLNQAIMWIVGVVVTYLVSLIQRLVVYLLSQTEQTKPPKKNFFPV